MNIFVNFVPQNFFNSFFFCLCFVFGFFCSWFFCFFLLFVKIAFLVSGFLEESNQKRTLLFICARALKQENLFTYKFQSLHTHARARLVVLSRTGLNGIALRCFLLCEAHVCFGLEVCITLVFLFYLLFCIAKVVRFVNGHQ